MTNSTAKAVTRTGSPRGLASENRQSPCVINRLVPVTSHVAHDNLQFFHYRHKITCKKNYVVSRSRVDIEGLLQYRGDDVDLMCVLLSILFYL